MSSITGNIVTNRNLEFFKMKIATPLLVLVVTSITSALASWAHGYDGCHFMLTGGVSRLN